MDEAIKSFGTYKVKAKLYPEISGEITVQVAEA
jgi:ribosomal protein L9